jgi:hypothetical protein
MATSTLLSVQEYLRLEPREDGLKDELIEGEIVLSRAAKTLHARIVRRMTKLLEPLEGLGYELETDFGCRLGKRSLPAADLAAVRLDRLEGVAQMNI